MLLTTVLLGTGLPNIWLTGHICSPARPFAAENWSQDLLLKFLSMLAIFFYQKNVFVKFVDASFLH